MFSQAPIPQPFSKRASTSPFFMFLSDQQKANKAQSADIKLLDLAANAIKEWDGVVSIRDEYTAKSLEKSEKSSSNILPNVQGSPEKSHHPSLRPPILHYDENGKPVRPNFPTNNNEYELWKNDQTEIIREEYPNIRNSDIILELQRRWKRVDMKTKMDYKRKAMEIEALYKQDLKFYEETVEKKLPEPLPKLFSF